MGYTTDAERNPPATPTTRDKTALAVDLRARADVWEGCARLFAFAGTWDGESRIVAMTLSDGAESLRYGAGLVAECIYEGEAEVVHEYVLAMFVEGLARLNREQTPKAARSWTDAVKDSIQKFTAAGFIEQHSEPLKPTRWLERRAEAPAYVTGDDMRKMGLHVPEPAPVAVYPITGHVTAERRVSKPMTGDELLAMWRDAWEANAPPQACSGAPGTGEQLPARLGTGEAVSGQRGETGAKAESPTDRACIDCAGNGWVRHWYSRAGVPDKEYAKIACASCGASGRVASPIRRCSCLAGSIDGTTAWSDCPACAGTGWVGK